MRSAGVLALGLAVAVARLAGQQLVATERAEVVATLWAEARYNFALWDRVRADWDSALSANLRLAAQPQSDVLFYRRLRRLVALLGDGQAAVVPPASLRSRIARPPLLLESVEQRPPIREYAEKDVVRRFDRAFPNFAGVTGLIVDLRHAAGGESRYGYAILARLTGRAFPVARWKTPQYRPVFRVLRAPDSAFSWYGPPPDTVFPSGHRPGYTGPIAVLASNATAGATADFLVAFRHATRGVIIGETSAGSPVEALTIALPKNWAMQLSVTRHAFPNGEEFAGKGIQPELTVSSTVADVQAGTDAALERAREYVGAKRR